MASQAFDGAGLIRLARPLLCIDTCCILDVMRDPTRDGMHAWNFRDALYLLDCMERKNSLATLVSDQVLFELTSNIDEVQAETQTALARIANRMTRIDSILSEFGSTGSTNTSHFNDHACRARAIVDRWVAACIVAPQSDAVAGRALRRVNQVRAPARRGKESMKDCVVLETYIEAMKGLRDSGFALPIVFLSSNTKDYEDGGRLRAELEIEFSALGVDFAPNFGAARHLLGL